MKRKFSQGDLFYGDMNDGKKYPHYLETLHPLVYQFELEGKAVCHLLGFKDQTPDSWNYDYLHKITKKNRKKNYEVGEKVLVKGHREELDGFAKYVFFKATIESVEKNNRYKVKYNEQLYFPPGSKKVHIKRKKIYKLK